MFQALLDLFHRPQPAASESQRRKDRRFKCSVPVRTADGEGAMITEVGPRGLRLQVPRALRPGTPLVLRFAGQAAQPLLQTQVVWCQKHGNFAEVGVRCLATDAELSGTWLTPLLRSITRTSRWVEDRHTVRFSTRVSAAMRRGDSDVSTFVEGHLTNVSRTGAAFCGSLSAQVGSPVVLRITPIGMEGVLVAGRVVRRGRSDDGRSEFGVRFDTTEPQLTRVLTAIMEQSSRRSQRLAS
ncbi:MAG: PilZ domain-containing protein [Candidatus Xenobia bacterium]